MIVLERVLRTQGEVNTIIGFEESYSFHQSHDVLVKFTLVTYAVCMLATISADKNFTKNIRTLKVI
jgi:hypothetical protein